MEKTIMIIDDDPNIRKMLEIIINKSNLGKIVCQLESGENAAEKIEFFNPDIVLIDLLLPICDGVAIVSKAKLKKCKSKFVMISQVDNHQLVGNAYNEGITFFIKKPINHIEVENIIKNISTTIDLENSLSVVKTAIFGVGEPTVEKPKINVKALTVDEQINDIFTEIGIIGTTGSAELKTILIKIIDYKKHNPNDNYKLLTIYDDLIAQSKNTTNPIADKRAMEQRIRRVLQKALTTIAEMGCEDYSNATFSEYSTLLFDFKQVRQEMRHISENSEPGKINTKKFIGGIISKIQN
ncbi:MAG: response regulator [Oscillospiraceae bacterium]